MVKNLREKRSSGVSDRPRRSVLIERIEPTNTLAKKTRSSISSQKTREVSPNPNPEQSDEKTSDKTNYSTDDDDENIKGACLY